MAKVRVIVDGIEYEVDVEELSPGKFRVTFDGESYEVKAQDLGIPLNAVEVPVQAQVGVSASSGPVSSVPVAPASPAAPVAGEGVVTSPMPGKILKILVKEGEEVKTGQTLLTLEAMKMENEIPSPKNGTIKKILIKEGDTVDTGQPLIEIG